MPDFAYVARDMNGKKIAGTIAATTKREAVSLLSGRSLFPVDVAPHREPTRHIFRRRVRGQLMATSYGQLSALLRSGVPLLRSITVLRDQTSHVTLGTVLEDVQNQVEDGTPLAEAMAQHPSAFSEIAVSMVRAGSEGGFLEDALDRVAQFTEQQEDLKSRTIGALAYPVFLAAVGTIVVAILMVFFVPNFEHLFARLRERNELPLLTDGLLWISALLQSWGLILLIVVVFACVYLQNFWATPHGRLRWDALKLRLPLFGVILQSLAVARFCRVLGTLIHNGVPILKSLEISGQAATNRLLAKDVAEAAENISGGKSLAEPLAKCGHFPADVVEMIAVAEESNTLDRVLVEIADGLERRTSRRLDLAVRLLEPIMLLFLAGIVLVIVIALLLPVLKMSSMI